MADAKNPQQPELAPPRQHQQARPAATQQRPAQSTAVATRPTVVSPRGVYTDLDALNSAFMAMQDEKFQRFNVCSPIMQPDIIPPLHAVAIRQVAIDTRVDQKGTPLSGDIYQDRRDKTKYGITKIGLDKFAAAANISWHPGYTGRVDDGAEQWFRRYRAVGIVLGLDATPRLLTAHKSIDLRDGKWGDKTTTWDGKSKTVKVVVEGGKDAIGMTEAALQEARKFIDEQCESKAMNRVLRKFAFIKGLYTRQELERPFVISALIFTGQTNDPELRREVGRAMVDRGMASTTALFGPAPTAAHQIEDVGQRTPAPPLGIGLDPDEDGEDDIEVEPTRDAAPPAAAAETPAKADDAGFDEKGERRFISNVKAVTTEEGTTNGRKWKRHDIKFDDCSASTFHNTPAGVAADAHETDRAVAVVVKANDRSPTGLELLSLTMVEETAPA